ncbi:RteC domain-containing protein [Mucilaginibacter paludis]|uniref:Tetracycline regulation of excision, RteC n=1 Tax=Mucilaginibacter paludis DSM 18603 TaxID=714943 RepID=H1XZ36_9SPHI|nr:RteC domain-containing protein [Mucilaginibacter paludis]EHQ24621.1 Tetracycline regulation of excision, RteC [Mucilaginibacter paludis DSM 18603]
MEKMIRELQEEMQAGLAGLAFENPVKQAREAVEVVFAVIFKLKDLALSYTFADKDELIRFHKEFKPLFVSELYYYLQRYRLESERPEPLKLQKEHLGKMIKRAGNWFDDHKAYIKYVRSGRTDRDAEFYLPGYQDKLYTPIFSFDRDPAFCSARGQEAALLLANRRLLAEWGKELAALKKSSGGFLGLPKLKWTFKAIDLVELIYGLYLTGAINNGKAELKDIAETFQQIFDVKLDNYSFTFTQSIHYRKSGSIRFLREMIEAILKKLDELDGK